MDGRNDQVGWSEAQWNLLRQTVSDAAARTRVAGGFLPIYGPLPGSTETVPTEQLIEDADPDGDRVDAVSTAPLIELSYGLRLSGTEVQEEDLSSARELFGRVASRLATYEDWTIFNGSPTSSPYGTRPDWLPQALEIRGGEQPYPSEAETVPTCPTQDDLRLARLRNIAWSDQLQQRFTWRLRASNPGALGLIRGAGLQVPEPGAQTHPIDAESLFRAIVSAVTLLETNSHAGPYYCVLSNEAFIIASSPTNSTLILPSDRIVPFLGREILHTNVITTSPMTGHTSEHPAGPHDVVEGIVLSLVGNSVDLAVSVDPTPEFVYVGTRGTFYFRVYERFALRIKQPNAIVKLLFACQHCSDGSGASRPVDAS
jgi:uncharacterized linocin/CFP29 family protein